MTVEQVAQEGCNRFLKIKDILPPGKINHICEELGMNRTKDSLDALNYLMTHFICNTKLLGWALIAFDELTVYLLLLDVDRVLSISIHYKAGIRSQITLSVEN